MYADRRHVVRADVLHSNARAIISHRRFSNAIPSAHMREDRGARDRPGSFGDHRRAPLFRAPF